MAAGLKVWRASQWTGAWVMGSVKVADLSGEMTGAWMGRVKGPSCQLARGWAGGLAAVRRAVERRAMVARVYRM